MKRQRLIGLMLAGFFLLNYPILLVFGKDFFFFGLPSLYLYLFACWLLIIAIAFMIILKRDA